MFWFFDTIINLFRNILESAKAAYANESSPSTNQRFFPSPTKSSKAPESPGFDFGSSSGHLISSIIK